ncbi:hypothetical protein AB0K00_23905 [Dactylosporangium sp. NPDC049525]|uniref:hypothetical protein n=1 Tax=Dactylosporangium sp. NPDC049525 TaxID=3154730 RepID=UPI00343E98DD
MDPLLLVRRVPAHRLAATRRITARWGTPATSEGAPATSEGTPATTEDAPATSEVQWWELVDPACDDEHPAAALAAVRPDGTTVTLVGVAAPPGRHDLAVQVLQGLVDALRAGSALRLAAALPPHGHEVLRQAGFQPGLTDVSWAVDL